MGGRGRKIFKSSRLADKATVSIEKMRETKNAVLVTALGLIFDNIVYHTFSLLVTLKNFTLGSFPSYVNTSYRELHFHREQKIDSAFLERSQLSCLVQYQVHPGHLRADQTKKKRGKKTYLGNVSSSAKGCTQTKAMFGVHK